MNFTEDKDEISLGFFSKYSKAGYTNLWEIQQKDSFYGLLLQEHI